MSSEQLPSFMVPGTNFGYSGVSPDTLPTENTIVVGLLDESASTRAFAKLMEEAQQNFIVGLKDKTDRADNLMYRHVHFSTGVREVHGYKPLVLIKPTDYLGCYRPGGQTHLYDSIERVVKETVDYALKHLATKRMANALMYVMSDGCHYGTPTSMDVAKQALEYAARQECLESFKAILLGVNDDDGVIADLKHFADYCGFAQFEKISEANPESLARATGWFVQMSVAASQALGTGGPSKNLTF